MDALAISFVRSVISGPHPCLMPGWRNWQTQWTQNPPLATACEFESRSRHFIVSPHSTSRSSDQKFPPPRPRLLADEFQNAYYVVHVTFGNHARTARERRRSQNRAFSVRQVAQRIGVEPAYLSKIERDQVSPPSETTIRRLAEELDEDPDALLAMAGKVSSDLRDIILRRPRLFADVLRQLKEMPDHAILRVVRGVRDGSW